MYIMCVCLFNTLSRRVGALQISIIIIINVPKLSGGLFKLKFIIFFSFFFS